MCAFNFSLIFSADTTTIYDRVGRFPFSCSPEQRIAFLNPYLAKGQTKKNELALQIKDLERAYVKT